MSSNSFFAYLERMKYIERWSLMHSSVKENVSEHSHSVTVIAHALAIIHNEIFGGHADELTTLSYAVYHETSEVITGDLPTPIKYFNAQINSAYKELESMANDKLLSTLPHTLKKRYDQFLKPDASTVEWKLVKAADRLAALIKCYEELKVNNDEFKKAAKTIEKSVAASEFECVAYFVKNFLPSYRMSLDDLD